MRVAVAATLLLSVLLLPPGAAPGAEPAPSVHVDSRTGLELLPVPIGELAMGSGEGDEDAQPVHRVRLSAFRMSRTEVTREHYARFLKDTGHAEPSHWKHELFSRPGSPVVGVTWDDAAAYCRWAGGRLPTEAEWEYAARGSDGRRYPWGSQEPDRTRAVFHLDIGFGGTQPTGSTKAGASPFGIEDLAGSVYEWCSDWYSSGYYRQSPAHDPQGPAGGETRVIRGGSWISLPDALVASARSSFPPGTRSVLIGIRVVR